MRSKIKIITLLLLPFSAPFVLASQQTPSDDSRENSDIAFLEALLEDDAPTYSAWLSTGTGQWQKNQQRSHSIGLSLPAFGSDRADFSYSSSRITDTSQPEDQGPRFYAVQTGYKWSLSQNWILGYALQLGHNDQAFGDQYTETAENSNTVRTQYSLNSQTEDIQWAHAVSATHFGQWQDFEFAIYMGLHFLHSDQSFSIQDVTNTERFRLASRDWESIATTDNKYQETITGQYWSGSLGFELLHSFQLSETDHTLGIHISAFQELHSETSGQATNTTETALSPRLAHYLLRQEGDLTERQLQSVTQLARYYENTSQWFNGQRTSSQSLKVNSTSEEFSGSVSGRYIIIWCDYSFDMGASRSLFQQVEFKSFWLTLGIGL